MGFICPMSSSSCARKFRDACSGWEFEECRQLVDFGRDTQIRLIDWIHLFQYLQEVALVGALPDCALHLPLEKFLSAHPFDECALCLDVTMLLTSEDYKFGELLSSLPQNFGIELWKFDL